jgi:hypothetical protein
LRAGKREGRSEMEWNGCQSRMMRFY